MINDRDLHCWYEVVPIVPTTAEAQDNSDSQLGTLIVEYEVRRFADVRSLQSRRGYIITCTQRVVIPNMTGQNDLGPVTINAYDYPVMLISHVSVHGTASCRLVDYSPKTLNSALSTTSSGSETTDKQKSTQVTSGSSTSDTNSYTTSVNSNGTEATEHSNSTMSSTMHGTAVGTEMQRASSESMSVKDWNVCAAVDKDNRNLRWFWGQQYPWDVLTYHDLDPDTNEIVLPKWIQDLLCDTSKEGRPQVFPPSQLSLFGVNFVSKASWLCYEPDNASGEPVQFTHLLYNFTGHHGYDEKAGRVSVQLEVNRDFKWDSPTLDLATLALDPVDPTGLDTRAVLGFVRSQFMYFRDQHNGAGEQFCLRSPGNNLLVSGSGFTIPVSNDAPMTADLTETGATMTILFKVADEETDLSLYLKHWKMTSLGCTMSIAVNDNQPIVRHIDALESGGGTNNVLRVILRSTDYVSDDYYDYLRLGLNKIDITITRQPGTAKEACRYAIRAMAIS